VFVPLFRGHLVKYNYILIFYNIDTMSSETETELNMENDSIDTAPGPAEDTVPAAPAAADAPAEDAAPAAPAADAAPAAPAADAAPAAPAEDAAPAAPAEAADKKTCVEPMDAAPTEDGKYVMFDGGNYKVFTMPTDAAMLNGASADAKFFKVVSGPMAGGKHKKQHKSAKKQHKSAKKQRKLAKKQHKSAKKQRKSRSSRRSKK
jgi:hypothetical protein